MPLTLLLPWTRLVGLGTGTFLTGLLSRFWPRRSVTRLSVFFGLGWGAGLIQDVIPGLPKFTGVQWYPIGAIAVLGLWMLQQVLWRRVGSTSADLGEETLGVRLSSLYAQAADIWGYVLSVGLLLGLTAEVSLFYASLRSLQSSYLAALMLLIAAILWRQWQAPQNSGVYLIGWGAELLLAEALQGAGGDLLTLSAATVALGLISLAIAPGCRLDPGCGSAV
ncbi:MAG: hypothetical protein HC816_02545 [Leptolyngbyaceae cyanobacterium RM1_1_2]|nr:hypothetical protein [Leptolyngbyaceae cyanobacterium RM1_1_2]